MADGDDGGTGTNGAVEDKIITFKLTDKTTFYINDTLAVSFKDDGTFKAYTVTKSGDNIITYTLTPNFYCDGTVANGKKCESKTTDECSKISFTIKTGSGDNKIEFEGSSPAGYTKGSLAEVEEKDKQAAEKALGDYSQQSTCKRTPDYRLPEETQIKFKIADNAYVYVKGTEAVRIAANNEYTYYGASRGDSNDGTTFTFKANNECKGTESPQSYTTTCGSETYPCNKIEEVTVKYTKGNNPSVELIGSTGYSDIEIDDSTKTNIAEYSSQTKCHVIPVPDTTNFKYTQGEYTFIIRNGDALKYKTDNKMEYTYYSGNKGVGSYGGSKYTFTAIYTCDNKNATECTTKAKADDCEDLTLEVNYYDGKLKIITPSDITDLAITTEEADSKLVENSHEIDFCKENDANSHPEAIGTDEIVMIELDDDEYLVLTKDKYYIKKDNKYQISRKLERKTIEGNNFTTFIVEEGSTIYESETGYVKKFFEGEIQQEGDCTAATKDFLSLSWCNKNCNNVTAIKNRLYSENEKFMIFNYNLTLRNGTNLVYEYQSESGFGEKIGNITDIFTALVQEDIGFSVLPTILVSIVLVLLL